MKTYLLVAFGLFCFVGNNYCAETDIEAGIPLEEGVLDRDGWKDQKALVKIEYNQRGCGSLGNYIPTGYELVVYDFSSTTRRDVLSQSDIEKLFRRKKEVLEAWEAFERKNKNKTKGPSLNLSLACDYVRKDEELIKDTKASWLTGRVAGMLSALGLLAAVIFADDRYQKEIKRHVGRFFGKEEKERRVSLR